MADLTISGPATTGQVTDTKNKANAAARYLGSNFSGGFMLLAVLAGLPPEKSQSVVVSLHAIYVSLQDVVGQFSNVWYVVFPVISGWLMKVGVNSSGFGVMMDKILTAAKSGNIEAAKTIVSAAASPEIGTKGIVNPVLAPAPDTPPTVVASASDLLLQKTGTRI